MRKFISKNRIIRYSLTIVSVVLAVILFQQTFQFFKSRVDHYIKGTFGISIRADSWKYRFPFWVDVDNVVINDLEHDNDELLRSPQLQMRFSLWHLIIYRNFIITDLNMKGAWADRFILNTLYEKGFFENSILPSPFGIRIEVILDDVTVFIGKHKDSVGYTHGDLHMIWTPQYVEIRGIASCSGNLSSGVYRQIDCSEEDPKAIKFIVEIEQKSDKFIPKVFMAQNRSLHANIWFEEFEDKFKPHGFMMLGDLQEPSIFEQQPLDNRGLNRIFNKLQWFLTGTTSQGVSDVDVYILDVDGLLDIQDKRISLKPLKFQWNNFLVNTVFDLDFTDGTKFNVDVRFVPEVSKKELFSNFALFQGYLSGVVGYHNILLDGSAEIKFKPTDARVVLKDIQFDLQNAEILMTHFPLLHAKVKQVQSLVHFDSHEYKVISEDVMINEVKTEDPEFYEFSANINGGRIQGKLFSPKFKYNDIVRVNADIDHVGTKLVQVRADGIPKLYGDLSGKVILKERPFTFLSDLTVKNGVVADAVFFQWLSEAFDLPELYEYNFQEANAQLEFQKGVMKFKNFNVKDDYLRIKGSLEIDQYDHITGNTDLGFSRDSLTESMHLRKVIGFFPSEQEFVNVLFQLSGKHNAINFQWLDSPDKEIVERKLPGFIKRIIERRVEKNLAK